MTTETPTTADAQTITTRLAVVDARRREILADRRRLIIALHDAGMTWRQVGPLFGLTGQRAHAIATRDLEAAVAQDIGRP